MTILRSHLSALFAIAIMILTTFPLAHAAAPDEYGVSAYTRRVLERAHAAENALGGSSATWSVDDVWSWMQNGMSAVFGTRDTAVTRTAEQQMLPQMTACQYADVSLIQQEMENVRRRLQQARSDKNTLATLRLMNLYEFLNRRIQVLEWGGTLVGAEDKEWNTLWNFDASLPPEERKKITGSGAIAAEKLCPFSTKYAELSVDMRYGCTAEVMTSALGGLIAAGVSNGTVQATVQERDAMTNLQNKLRDLSASALPEDRQVESCVSAWPEGYRTWSSGRFQEIPGARFLTLLKLLWHIELLRPSAYLPDTPFTWNVGKNVLNPLLALQTRTFNLQQARDDAILRIGAVESQGMEEAFSPLTKTIGELARLVRTIHPEQGDQVTAERSLRDSVRDAAFFLRRSCMNRQCNSPLERVLKIVTTDECFPYTAGDADLPKDATEDDRRQMANDLQQKCAAKSGMDAGSL